MKNVLKFLISSVILIAPAAHAEVLLTAAKKAWCFTFAPGGTDIIDFQNSLYCQVTIPVDNCLAAPADVVKAKITAVRYGKLSFSSGDAGFLEVSIEGKRNPIKIFEPLVEAAFWGQVHRAEDGRWVADPFRMVTEGDQESGDFACTLK